MNEDKYYIEHEGKVLEAGGDMIKFVMAVTLNPVDGYKTGITRCIVNREGEIGYKGFRDYSELHKISCDSLFSFRIGERLNIKNENEIIKKFEEEGKEFIGLEDPDIWIDKDTGLTHLYFTIPIIDSSEKKNGRIHLGHAVGKDINSLEMTEPVLVDTGNMRAKEVSIAPVNKQGLRFNLFESCGERTPAGGTPSTVRVAIAKDMNGPWEFGETVFNPKEHDVSWIAKHASPGPLMSHEFIDVGEGKLLGFINGREVNQGVMPDGRTKHGIFSVGLFIYDYEMGKVDWVSEVPFIRDSEAKTITFASQFIETGNGEGILYAHVDDSFVRAYTIKSDWLRKFINK